LSCLEIAVSASGIAMFVSPAFAQTAPSYFDRIDIGTLIVVAAFLVMAVFLFKAYRRGRVIGLGNVQQKAPGASTARVDDIRTSEPVRPPARLDNAVFVSYRRTDSIDITGRIYDKLVSELGRGAIFKDIDSIPLGSDFRKHIDDSLKNCKAFLLVMGKNWKGEPGASGRDRIDDPRDLIRIEVETALRRNIPVIPVLVQGAEIPSDETLPESMRDIAYRQAIRVRSDPDFHRDVERIALFLKSHLGTS
jgi:hypothetical protein